MEGQWKFQGGLGSQKPKYLNESMGLNWNFQRGGGFIPKSFSGRGNIDIVWNNTILLLLTSEIKKLGVAKISVLVIRYFVSFQYNYRFINYILTNIVCRVHHL